MRRNIIFLILVILLSYSVYGLSGGNIVGDSQIFETSEARMVVTPHTAYPGGDGIYRQSFTITNKLANPISNLWFAFRFPVRLNSPNVWGIVESEIIINGSPVLVEDRFSLTPYFAYNDKSTIPSAYAGYYYYSTAQANFGALETKTYEIEFSPSTPILDTQKYDMAIWQGDWDCILDDSCGFSRILDPFFGSTQEEKQSLSNATINASGTLTRINASLAISFEQGTAVDDSLYSQFTTNNASFNYDTSINSTVATFNGINQYINGTIPELNTTEGTISMFINPLTPPGTEFLFHYADTTTADNVFHFQYRSNDLLRAFLKSGGTNQFGLYTNNTLNENEWQYVTFIHNISGNFIYVNGNLVDIYYDISTDINQWIPNLTSPNSFTIGARHESGALSLWFNGSIDCVTVHNRALSPSEISTEYNSCLNNMGLINVSDNTNLTAITTNGTTVEGWYLNGTKISSEDWFVVNETGPLCANMTNAPDSVWTNCVYALGIPDNITNSTITAIDLVDSSSINDFTVMISNSSYSFNYTASGASLSLSLTGNYNATLVTSGYFNTTEELTFAELSTHQLESYQAILRIRAKDNITTGYISTFNVTLNNTAASYNNYTTDGYANFYLTAGNYTVNLSAFGYTNLLEIKEILSLSNATIEYELNPIAVFNLIDEQTGGPFNVSSATSINLNIYCTNKTLELSFTDSTDDLIIDCAYYMMKMDVNYNGSLYYRTLVPDLNSKNITWYLIDLTTTSSVQTIFKLNDLTGQCSDYDLTIKRYINENLATIETQPWDLEAKVVFYLVQNALYSQVEVRCSDQTRSIGPYLASEAGSKTITIPSISFMPENNILGTAVSWAWSSNISAGIIRLIYSDADDLTTNVSLYIYNSTNMRLLYFASLSGAGTITYNSALENVSYLARMIAYHPTLGQVNSTYSVFLNAVDITWAGITESAEKKWKQWLSILFLLSMILLFSKYYVKQMVLALAISIFIVKYIGWLIFPRYIAEIIIGVLVLLWIAEMVNK